MPAWEGQMHVNSPDLAQRQPRLEAFRKTPYLSIPEAGWKSRFASMTPAAATDPVVVETFAKAAVQVEVQTPTGPQLDMVTLMPMLNPKLMPVPTMLIHGEYDDVADLDRLLPFFQQQPNPYKRYVVIPNAGHMMYQQGGHRLFQHEVVSFFKAPAVGVPLACHVRYNPCRGCSHHHARRRSSGRARIIGIALQAGHRATMRQDAGIASPVIRRSFIMETLLDGVNHIALLTRDMDRFIRFYQEAFDATVVHDNRNHAGHVGERMVIMAIGGQSAFNVFEVPGNTQAHVQTPMFGRGRLDHFGLNARSRETFEQARIRLMHLGASDGTITDFGSALSVFFRDPDGLEAEVVWNKDPETRAAASRPA